NLDVHIGGRRAGTGQDGAQRRNSSACCGESRRHGRRRRDSPHHPYHHSALQGRAGQGAHAAICQPPGNSSKRQIIENEREEFMKRFELCFAVLAAGLFLISSTARSANESKELAAIVPDGKW